MAKSQPPRPQAAQLSIDQMRLSIPKLQRRITELEAFDVNTIQKRWDPVMESLVNKINGTLQEILGRDSAEYRDYHTDSLDTLPLFMGGGPDPLHEVIAGYKQGIHRAIVKLRTLKEIFEERIADAQAAPSPVAQATARVRGSLGSKRVFIVHGHDEGAKEAIARYLSALDLVPVILHEQPNQGRTIIEKFEAHADVDFAVVLLTPDDMGYSVAKPNDAKPRARQNVVLELGFFLGALGRHKVVALCKGELDLPSDYDGVLYIDLDARGGWRLAVAREMKSSGLEVDMNKAM